MTKTEERMREVLREVCENHGYLQQAGWLRNGDEFLVTMHLGLRIVIAAMIQINRDRQERCARIAEAQYAGHGNELGTPRARHYEHASRKIAAAIREDT